MISVVVVTNRVGGMDVLRAGLRLQSFTDFELVIVDELYAERSAQLKGYFNFPFVHVRPFETKARWGNYMRSLNTALRVASGERLVFWSDYTCAAPETLAAHASFHDKHPDDVMLGAIRYVATPELHGAFPRRYGWGAIGHKPGNGDGPTYQRWLDAGERHSLYQEFREAYENDLRSGLLDAFMLSTFRRPLEKRAAARSLPTLGIDDRTAGALNLKNDSIPRAALDAIGGFDERADGCHGHQDSLTGRQLQRTGVKLVARSRCTVALLDPHEIAIIRRMDRPDTSNLELYEAS